jgi:hypothetical protein
MNVKIEGQDHPNLLFYVKGIIQYEFLYLKLSTKYSSSKFWNIYGSAFDKKDQISDLTSGSCIMSLQFSHRISIKVIFV